MRSSAYLPLTIAACLAAPCSLAAELGDIQVSSHSGQPLSAQIELTALAPDEVDGLPVRLASPDVYQSGRIALDPALQSLRISQVQRDGRRYLQLATEQPINAGHVHLYFQMGSGSRAIIRLATVMLTPAPPAPPAPAPAPASALSPAPARPVAAARPASTIDAAALAARARAEGMVRPPAIFVQPAVVRPVTLPRAPSARQAKPAASCAPQSAGMAAAECVALDQQNAELNDKLGVLEGKVGALQKALAAPAAAATADPAQPHARSKPLSAKEKKAASVSAGSIWWVWLGGALLLAVLAAVLLWLRKRKQAAGNRAPSKYWVLLRKPFGRKTVPVMVTEPADMVTPEAEPEPEPFSR
ncbi:type IV pilus assembly protein FimV [Janthinobacterium aquaticum]|uniref:type IV pilus assembly protein FimV n=1 Tax=Janthinobacterium sp. FT58W TaxID=2654254 RepID=UPI0012659E5B|nr:hypothetical protein [Janthinobacterium sp. FT58W]KAB8041323.1 hypothetical protein GCM43_17985 [Janthinobacterium sp. FT58W]